MRYSSRRKLLLVKSLATGILYSILKTWRYIMNIKKLPIHFLCAVLLLGCSTPSDHLKEGATAEFTSSYSAQKAASCVARNGDDFFQGYSGTVRDSGIVTEPVEVVVRAGQNIFAVVQVSALPAGSQVKVFFRSWAASIFPKKDGLTVEQRLTKGCL